MFKSTVIMAACATSIASATKLSSMSRLRNRQRLYMYMNDPQAAAQVAAASPAPVTTQAVNTWVQPDFRSHSSASVEPRNLVGKLHNFPIQDQVRDQNGNLFSQSQIEERLKEQRRELEASFELKLTNLKLEH